MPESLPSILLLEADAMTQELYRRELGRHYRVLTCENEHEALDLLHANDIQAIILEPAWAGAKGWLFLATIKEIITQRRISVVICSVWDERRYGWQSGIGAYLVKPVLPVTLLETLRRILKVNALSTSPTYPVRSES